jgi:hypothetical protein
VGPVLPVVESYPGPSRSPTPYSRGRGHDDQFIPADAYHRLGLGHRAEAHEVLRLFDMPVAGALGPSPEWLPVRAAFKAAAAFPPRAA